MPCSYRRFIPYLNMYMKTSGQKHIKLVTYRTKSTSGGHILRVFDQIKELNLLQRGLTGGQPPRFRQYLNTKVVKGDLLVKLMLCCAL